MSEPERLQKVMARAGIASRRAGEVLIEAGRVTVNGEVAVLGRRVDSSSDVVAVDGVAVPVDPSSIWYMLNKPVGVISTAWDPQARPAVTDLVASYPRVFPVGRLDAATEGLLLLTNDGDLAHRVAHPSFGAEKEYLANVAGSPGRRALSRLREGVVLDDGPTAPAKVSLVGPGLLRIVVHEGRNRLVRRMCAEVGHPVLRLVRTRVAGLRLAGLAPGAHRLLAPEEVVLLARAVSGAAPPDRPGPPGDRPGWPEAHQGSPAARGG
ncbi:MAG: pseudouridine synthase [Acidimicrobiales bacterium]